MADSSSIVELYAIADVIDSRHKTPSYSNDGHPMVRVVDVRGGTLNLAGTKRVSDEIYTEFSKGRDPRIGDLVISRVGSYGNVSYVATEDKFCLGQNTAMIVPKVNSRFLYYQLTSPLIKQQIDTMVVGAVQKTISLKSIKQLQVRLPSEEQQNSIAHILSTLDDKIELNRQMNATLESIAQALFKSWFVDFDPVIDNALEAGNPIPEPLKARAERRKALGDLRKPLPGHIQSQFPNSFVFSEELGWIPVGWPIKTLGSLCETISKGTTPRKSDIEDATDQPVIPFLKVRDLDNHGEIHSEGFQFIPRSIHSKALKRSMLKTGDVLFSIAGTIGRSAIVTDALDDANVNQAIAFVRPRSRIMTDYIHQFLRSEDVQSIVQSRVVQAVQANFSLTELSGLSVLDPGEKILTAWHEHVSRGTQKINSLRDNTKTVAEYRDLILPRLLSGQLRVPEAEAELSEAL
jgi:type I restriction enzyme S subunit